MTRRAQFSVFSIMLFTLCVALVVTSLGVWNRSVRTAQRLVTAQTQLKNQEAVAAARDRQLQAEFFGHFPPPILTIDLKTDKASPLLIAILNSKNFPQQQNITFGQFTNDPKRVRFDLQLLRSLDKKDYYRLKWGVDGAIDQPNEQGLATVLFEYDGKTLTLVNNDQVSIVLAPNRQTAIETIAGLRPAEEAAALAERWLSQLTVQFNFVPMVRPAVNMDHFK